MGKKQKRDEKKNRDERMSCRLRWKNKSRNTAINIEFYFIFSIKIIMSTELYRVYGLPYPRDY